MDSQWKLELKKKKPKTLYKARVCVLYLHTKQIRYNLESQKYTVCIVQDKVGELVMPSGPVPLWNFCVRGNCSGMILSLLHTITGAHLWTLPSHHLYHMEHRSTSAALVFSERRHAFYSNNCGGIPDKLSPLRTTATRLAERFLIWGNHNMLQER